MSDYLAAKPGRPQRKKHIWPYLAGLVIVLAWAILTLPAFIHGIAPYATADGMSSGRVYFYFAVRCFIQALGVWLLISAPFIKWQGAHPGFFFILLIAAVAPDVAVIHQAQARAALYHYGDTRMQGGLAEAKSAALTTIRFGPQPESEIDVQARAVGAAGQVGQAWRRLLDGVASDLGGYDTRIATLGLQPARLDSAQPAADARAKIVQARGLIDSYQRRGADRFTAYQAEVARIGTAANGQGKVLADKGNGLKSRVDALWSKRRAILTEEDAMFSSKGDMTAYHRHQTKLGDLASEAQQQQSDMQQYASELSGQITAAAGETEDQDQ